MALIKIRLYSETLRQDTTVNVMLPSRVAGKPREDIYAKGPKLPVLYLLHGTYGGASDFFRNSRIEFYARKYNIAIVCAEAGNSCFRNLPRYGTRFYDFFADELPTIMQWMFPISDKREENFIGGLSMGGHGAFKIGMSNPDRFGSVICMSAVVKGWQEVANCEDTIWSYAFEKNEDLTGTDDDLYALAEKVKKSGQKVPELYICVGQQDFLYKSNQEFRKHLDTLDLAYTYDEMPGMHDWDFWDAELKKILTWLPIPERSSEYGPLHNGISLIV